MSLGQERQTPGVGHKEESGTGWHQTSAWGMRLGERQMEAYQAVFARLGRALRERAGARADYRERISVATWLVVLTLGASVVIDLPAAMVSFWAFGSPVTLPFTDMVWFAIFLALVAAAGAQSVVATHPAYANRISVLGLESWPFWALPMALTSIAVVLLPLAPSPAIQVIAILFSGMLVALAYAGLYATVDRGQAGSRRARLLLDVLAYGSALLLFLFVYQTRTRSLVSGSLVAVTAMLLAMEILRTVTPRARTALTYGGIVGLVLGQVTWALNYWVLPGLTGGLLLLLIFYLMVGIAQHGLQGRLSRRVLIEFFVFMWVALALIALVGPGFSLPAA